MLRMWKIVVFVIVILGACGGWVYRSYQQFLETPLSLGGDERVITIPAGATARDVVQILVENGVLKREWMMLYAIRQSGLSSRLQPGSVVIRRGMTPRELPEVLAHVGKYARQSVQINSGMNLYDVAERLQGERIADSQYILTLSRDPAFVAELGVPAQSLEGYLAPGAYTFDAGTSARDVLTAMHARWRSNWSEIVEANRGAYEQAMRRHLTAHDLVTLASMVEKEAMVDVERPVIARVFYNRLGKKMKLQSDPTCVYPPLEPGERPTPARCKDPQNRYSTYVHEGLPPGPIAIPSPASLRAALLPYKGVDDRQLLYFVARQDGTRRHYISKSYAEHQTAVDFYLKGKTSRRPRGTVQPAENAP